MEKSAFGVIIPIIPMKYHLFVSIIIILFGCSNKSNSEIGLVPSSAPVISHNPDTLSYNEIKARIQEERHLFKEKYPTLQSLETDSASFEIARFWINMVAGDLFLQWKGTPWDFNGTTTLPRKGNIACGYFVTTLLSDMGVQLNRRKLSTCASSEMMRQLVPGRPLINLSKLSYKAFCDSIRNYDPGVFIIGLDYHTGFIVVDSTSAWFIHSYYAANIGVIKEVVELSPALLLSKTKWLMPLTADKDFVQRWLHTKTL